MAGFDAVHVQAGIPQQTVTVHLADIVEGELFFFINRVFVRHVADQRLADQRHIACGAVLTLCVQAVYRLEVGVLQAQLADVGVHQVNECVLAAGHVVGHGHTGVVT